RESRGTYEAEQTPALPRSSARCPDRGALAGRDARRVIQTAIGANDAPDPSTVTGAASRPGSAVVRISTASWLQSQPFTCCCRRSFLSIAAVHVVGIDLDGDGLIDHLDRDHQLVPPGRKPHQVALGAHERPARD